MRDQTDLDGLNFGGTIFYIRHADHAVLIIELIEEDRGLNSF